MTNKDIFIKAFGYDGSIVCKCAPDEFGTVGIPGSCGYLNCSEGCASRHFPRCPLWWEDDKDDSDRHGPA